MDLDSLSQLEERITKAISRIEQLTDVKKKLEDENRQLKDTLKELEQKLNEKEAELATAARQSDAVSERVKEKVESLLTKIDNYEESLS